jgi:non-specific serine/threonine protein kinase
MPSLPPRPLKIRLFGLPEFLIHGEPMPRPRTRKGSWLLALLALRQGGEIERDWLAATLWPECRKQRARANLRMCLMDLRRALGVEAWRLRSPTERLVCLDLADSEVDVLTFDAAMAEGELARAVDLHHGPLLEGCADLWAFQERQHREEACAQALESLAHRANAGGERALAETYLRRAVAVDPLRETAHRMLMQIQAAAGNHAAALDTYRGLGRLLHRELNAKPDAETHALFVRLQAEARQRELVTRGRTAGQSHDATLPSHSSAVVSPAPRHNLPHRSTSFIGREREVAAIRQHLTTTRLLTLTGAGGCGKSRLALETAWTLVEELPDGVWLVELASLADPELIPQQVGATLGVREQPGRPWTEMLVGALRPKQLLLVLDNCEHLLAGCVALIDLLLRGCPEVRVLTTSREPLGMLGETALRVPPLTYPEAEAARPRLEELIQYEAVRLFVERAGAASLPFALTAENAAAVARLCRGLDGIPLALEMAASRVRAMPVAALAERLDDRFRLLADGNRAALPRHRTLRAMLEWSYDLLSEPERILLHRLSVFAGGWTLEAAEAVTCGEAPIPAQPGTHDEAVVDLLTKLVDKSLVVYEDRAGEARYRFLETVRQFAGERLEASGEREALRRRHADYYLALAEAAEPHLTGPEQQTWLERLERERDNLRAALGWAAATPVSHPEGDAAEIGLRLAAAVRQFWFVRGDYTEGRGWLARLLGLLGEGEPSRAEVPLAARARALYAAGALAWPQGDGQAARALLQESLSLARELEDRPLIAQALVGLGAACYILGDLEAARSHYEESLAISRELGDQRRIAVLYNNLGKVTSVLGEYQRSRSMLEESLRIARAVGDRQSTGPTLAQLGILQMTAGDYPKALGYCEESLALAKEVGDPRTVATAYGVMGTLARHQQDLVTARARYRESLQISQALGGHEGLYGWLAGLGCVEVMSGEAAGPGSEAGNTDFCRGTRLLGAAEALREATAGVLPAWERADYERCVAAAREALGEAAFAAAWAEGRALSLDEAVAYALEEVAAAPENRLG